MSKFKSGNIEKCTGGDSIEEKGLGKGAAVGIVVLVVVERPRYGMLRRCSEDLNGRKRVSANSVGRKAKS
ncbi:hypothetical protein AKJ41_05570 [candidate division MSBL1 archaeon SCGC-AAA259O05]|uniref:Uncharacterized protein n=1 Tax=candidate division MSBL1 archaeon SCGC-AAA259O05 TaxID=1698271 RepID=A0A133UYW0_9EURY|nr:hypothetical protein AKJ41_05570 [candidate division MSBL1 archaeon SCGC-AAA259O05]